MNLAFSINNISKSYGDDTLFENLSFDFKTDEKLGLIGMNGSGKSTLLKIIAGQVSPDTGEILTRKDIKIIYLPQEDLLFPDKTIEEHLYQYISQSPDHEKERHRIMQKMVGKTGFPDTSLLVSELSGGWKKKLAITRALCCEPDLLLMDEPTNHLDIDGILWLEDILKTASFSFIAVSHDRSFLEAVCSNIMEIGQYYPNGYFRAQGEYSKFEKERLNFLKTQEKQLISLAGKMRREDEWLKQGAKARTTKAKYRIEQAGQLRMELSALKGRTKASATLGIDFEATGRQTKALLRAFHISKAMNGKTLFSDLSFELRPGSVLGILGQNGTGKSTLLSILENQIKPDAGKIEWAPGLKISVFDQSRSKLDPSKTLKDALNPAGGDSVNYRGNSIHIVSWAKRFLFMPDQLEMPVEKLSGGEKARILLANIMLSPCDVLFLDEPTNDLDILSLEVLEESILQFAGAVVIVTHDRYLMNRVCQKILYLDSATAGHFFSSFDQIMIFREKKSGQPEKTKKPQKKKQTSSISFSFNDKFELEHMEEKILEAENDVEKILLKLKEPEILSQIDQMNHLCELLKEAQEKVQSLYERWEYLEAKKDGKNA